MSRNYFEFKDAEEPKEKESKKIVMAQDEPEDFGGISELLR